MNKHDDFVVSRAYAASSYGNRISSDWFIERLEKLEADKEALKKKIDDVWTEAAKHGYGVNALKKDIAIRKLSRLRLPELEALIAKHNAAS